MTANTQYTTSHKTDPKTETSKKLQLNTTQPLQLAPTNTSLRTHIHTQFTAASMLSQNPNSRLGRRPPPICEEEETLSRVNRVHLTRLRCGDHPVLPSYTHRINLSDTDSCTLCNQAQGTLEHIILHCPHLDKHRDRYNIHTLYHLWTRPLEVCNFPGHTYLIPPHTIAQPWWWVAGGRPRGWGGLNRRGGSLLEEPLGLYY